MEEVCSSFGLTDVDIQYTDADFENLTSYKLFQQHVRPLLVKENPKVSFDAIDIKSLHFTRNIFAIKPARSIRKSISQHVLNHFENLFNDFSIFT